MREEGSAKGKADISSTSRGATDRGGRANTRANYAYR